MIGLSLSYCVRDLVEEKVHWKDVDYIITSTRCATPQDWLQCVVLYQQSYWREYRSRAVGAVTRLLDGNMIHQPRLTNDVHIPKITATGHWVTSEDEIVWADS